MEKAGAVAPVGGGATTTVNGFVVQIKERSAYCVYSYSLLGLQVSAAGVSPGYPGVPYPARYSWLAMPNFASRERCAGTATMAIELGDITGEPAIIVWPAADG